MRGNSKFQPRVSITSNCILSIEREAGSGKRVWLKPGAGHMAILMDMRTIWVPSGAEERGYYDRLFQLADVSNNGKLAGQSAVVFLARSGLAFPILKQVNYGLYLGREKRCGERKEVQMVMLRV